MLESGPQLSTGEPAAGRRILAKAKRVCRLGRADWQDLGIAMVELLRARWRIARTPAARLLAELRRSPPPPTPARADALAPERVAWAVQTAARVVPWRSDCLVQAMAAQRWLGRERRRTQLIIGVHKESAGHFEAHAWLRCGTFTVTGGDVARFTPLLVPPED